jgi:diguanylate cyclase (GGDEF)-like protein
MAQPDYAALLNPLPAEWIQAAERQSWRWLRFTPELEKIFARYYDLRFRGWVQVASLVLACVYSLRLLTQFVLFQERVSFSTTQYVILVFISAVMPWVHYALTALTTIKLERLDWVFTFGMTVLLITVQIFHQDQLNQGFFSPFLLPTYQALMVAPVALRLRFWTALLFIFAIGLAPLFLSTLLIEEFSRFLVVQVFGAIVFSCMMSYLLEWDARQDFINRALIHQLANTDALTGVFTRRHFFERAQAEFQRAQRYRHNLAVVVFDVDYFKKLNDTYGHHAGDHALQALAEVSRQQLRASDVLARLGGEEFAVLLPETSLANAAQLAERLRLALAHLKVNSGPHQLQLTASFGVSAWHTTDAGVEVVLHRADRELYYAKQTGRNRVSVSKPLAEADHADGR